MSEFYGMQFNDESCCILTEGQGCVLMETNGDIDLETCPAAPATTSYPVYSYGISSLNDAFIVGSYLPFNFTDNQINYYMHLDGTGSTSTAACSLTDQGYILSAGTTVWSVNKTKITHGITDANAQAPFDQPLKKFWKVVSIDTIDTTVKVCTSVPQNASPTKQVRVQEHSGFMLPGTKWTSNSYPSMTFYYGLSDFAGNKTNHITNGNGTAGGTSTMPWEWDINTSALSLTISVGGSSQAFTGSTPNTNVIGDTMTIALVSNPATTVVLTRVT
jgi:hypothetical protein